MGWTKLPAKHPKCIRPSAWASPVGAEWRCEAKLTAEPLRHCHKMWKLERNSEGRKEWVEFEAPAFPENLPTVNGFVAGHSTTPVPRAEVLYWTRDTLEPVPVPRNAVGLESIGVSDEVIVRVVDALLEHFDVVRRP